MGVLRLKTLYTFFPSMNKILFIEKRVKTGHLLYLNFFKFSKNHFTCSCVPMVLKNFTQLKDVHLLGFFKI